VSAAGLLVSNYQSDG